MPATAVRVKKKITERQKNVAAQFKTWCEQNPNARHQEQFDMLDEISDMEYFKENECHSDE